MIRRPDDPIKVCSLLPSATEIVFALGLGDSLVGITHECDYPPETVRIPRVTSSNIPEGLPSSEIDRMVSSNLLTEGTLYELNRDLLEELVPELILTQRLCDVCAVAYDKVKDTAAGLSSKPKVVNLEPHSLDDILENIRLVGSLLGVSNKAEEVIAASRRRIDAIESKTRNLSYRPRVFVMEWVDPPYCGGHWISKMVDLAGGVDELANPDRPSYRIEWKRVLEFAPEIIVLTCCGYKLPKVVREAADLTRFDHVYDLPAVKNNRVYATNGSDYFSRPGPRIIDSLEILAHLVHPEIFPVPKLADAFASVDLAAVPVR